MTIVDAVIVIGARENKRVIARIPQKIIQRILPGIGVWEFVWEDF